MHSGLMLTQKCNFYFKDKPSKINFVARDFCKSQNNKTYICNLLSNIHLTKLIYFVNLYYMKLI